MADSGVPGDDTTSNPQQPDGGRRIRTLTEKAQGSYETRFHHFVNRLSACKRAIEEEIIIAREQSTDTDRLPKCLSDLEELSTKYAEISRDFTEWLSRLNTDESLRELSSQRIIEDATLGMANGAIQEFKTLIHDSRDNISSVSHSSRRSRSSYSSRTSSTIIMRQRAKAEAARARLHFLSEELELQRQELEIQNNLKVLNAKRESAIAEAELRAMLDNEDEQRASVRDSRANHTTTSSDRVQQYVEEQNGIRNVNETAEPQHAQLNPNADEFIAHQNSSKPHSSVQSVHEGNVEVKETRNKERSANQPELQMANELTRFLLRKDLLLQRLTNFNDQADKYPVWKSSFVHVVRDLDVRAPEELYLLIKYLGPESSKYALNIRAANASDPDKALNRVWERLEERYSAPEMIESTLKHRLYNFPKITQKDYKKLYELSDLISEISFLKENEMYGSLLAYFDTSSGVNQIVTKLPPFLQRKWTDRAMKYKTQYKVPFPPFTEFVDFLREMSKLLNDPCFVYETKTNDSETTFQRRPVRARNDAVSTRKTGVEQSVSQSAGPLCPLHKTKHSLNNCKGFRRMSLKDRKQYLIDNNICYKCCELNAHRYRDCKQQSKCAICSSTMHPTALHTDNRDPSQRDKDRKPSTNDGEEIPQQDNVQLKCTALCGKGFAGRSCSKTVLVDVHSEVDPQ